MKKIRSTAHPHHYSTASSWLDKWNSKELRYFLILTYLCTATVLTNSCYATNYPTHIQKLISSGYHPHQPSIKHLQEGDIIFQISLSAQSQAIQLATGSTYSHCGIIFKEGSTYYVLEAVQPVKRTPLTEWIKRGKDGHYVVKRLIDAKKILTENVIHQMKQVGRTWEGKDYDLAFEWTDEKMYCSELIWKIYKTTTDIKLSELEYLKDFDLSNTLVKKTLQERYGNDIPWDETVISPAALYNSNWLETVH